MKPTDRELADMLGYAALRITSYKPDCDGLRLPNCWCMVPWRPGHDAGCTAMRTAVKAWKGSKKNDA